MQARLVSTIRSASACNSMSSQTHPQKVQVACFTMVSSCLTGSGMTAAVIDAQPIALLCFDLGLSGVRTGRRDNEASPQREPDATPAGASRHEPPGLDFFPPSGSVRVGVERLGSDFLSVFTGIIHVKRP